MLMYATNWSDSSNSAFAIYDTLKSQTANTDTIRSSFTSAKYASSGSSFTSNGTAKNNVYNSSSGKQNEPTPNTLNFSKSIAFDPNGTGRKDHVATVGVWKNKYVYVFVYDTVNNIWYGYEELGYIGWMSDGSAYYIMTNYLSITAGDYDGDHKDSVVIYI